MRNGLRQAVINKFDAVYVAMFEGITVCVRVAVRTLRWSLLLAIMGGASYASADPETSTNTTEVRTEDATAATGKSGIVAMPTPLLRTGRQHRNTALPLDQRVDLLAKEIDLDTTQRIKVKTLLEGQREQVRKVWSDSSVPAAYRISATQAISDRTADQIRELLNEEQRKKYNLPRQAHEAANETNRRSMEEWMDAIRPRGTSTDAAR